MTVQVDVQFAVRDETAPSAVVLSDWVDRTVRAANADQQSEVSVRVVDDVEIRKLNNDFRQQDKPTNVLSFPSGAVAGLPANIDRPLGDIVICASVVQEEAMRQGKPLADHWAHMVVHGTLHLLGFDHKNDDDARKMEGLEKQILTAHGIANPYTI